MKKGSKSETTANLRQKAEDLLKKKLSKSGSLPSEAETKKLIHELEIHQIELELQNEELALAKEQVLKAATEKYAELYNFAPAGIFTLSQKGEIIDINLYGSQMLGRESLHLKNSIFNFFVSDDTKPIFNLFLNKIFKNKTEESCQVILSESVNPPMYLQLTGLTTKNGEQCLVTAVDISKLKRIEDALAESETKYRTMVTQSPDGFFIADLMGNFLSVNKSMCDVLKYSEEEFLSMKILDIVVEQNQPHHKLRLEAMLNGESTNEDSEYEIIGKDGTIHFVEVRSSLITRGKEPIGFQGIAHEITKRKRAEKVLRESEEKYRNIFENIQDVYYETTIDGIILEVSPSIRFMSRGQFKRGDVIGKSMYDFYTNTLERQVLISTLKEQGSVIDFEVMLKTPNGLQIPCSISSKLHLDDSGKPLKIIGNLHDITKRNQTEKALIASETRYRRLFESAKDGILILDAETGKIMDVNPFLVETLGYSHEQFIEKTIWEIGFFKDIIANHDKFLELQQQEYVRYDNLPLETAAGRKINVEFVSNVYLVDKKKVIQCNIRDTTERKRIENALIISETHLRMLVQTIPDLIWTKDAGGIFLSCNAMFERFFGANENAIIGKTDYDFVDRELADFFRENDRKAMAAGKPTSNEEWITFADDGHRAYLETIKAPMYDAQNRLIGVLGIGRDITDRKKAIDELKDKNTFIQTVLDNLPIGVALNSIDSGTALFVNKKFEEIYGWPKDEMNDITSFFEKVYPNKKYREEILARVVKDIQSGDASRMHWEDCIITHEDGSTHIINAVNIPLFDQNTMVSTVVDITERKHVEEALQESLERYKKLTLISPVGIFHTDENGVTTFVNPVWCQISGLSFEDALGDGWLNAVHPDDKKKLAEGWNEATQNQKASLSYYRFVRPDRSIAWVMGQTILETNAEGKTIGYIGTITDITERKHAEDTLKDNNIFLQTLLNAIPAPVFYKDLEGRFIGFNKAFELFFGKTAQELAGKTVFDISPQELAEIYHAKDMELFQHPGTQIYDSQLSDKQGIIHDVVYHKASIMDSNDHVNGLVGVILDISERKQAEKVLNDLIDKNPMSIQIMDKHGFTLKINTAYSSLFGAIPPPNFSVLADLQNKGFSEYILLAKKGEVVNFPDIYYNVHDVYTELPDKPVWVRAVLFSLTDPNSIIERFVFMHEDITERKRAEKEITMLAQSLKSINECVSVTDLEDKILFVNESFLKTYGYEAYELIGKNISIVNSQRNVNELINKILPTTIHNEWHGELLNKRKDGTEFPIYLSTATIKDNENNILGLIGVATDITERKRTEKELIEAKDKAEENDRLKTAFLQNISHEIRTPMNAIIGFSELVEMGINDPEKVKDYTKIIRQRSNDLLGIINDLLDIARIESDQLSIKYNQVDLNLLFEDIRSLYAEHKLQIEKSSINLIVKGIPANLNSIVSTDIGKLKQIFSNLIHNAFKFTNEGKIEFGFHSISNNNITFFVSDTGPGIAENIKDLIFERFRKSANESIYVQDGMGLGLAIVKGLLKLFNGEICIESEPNEGSTFFFTIPYIPITVNNAIKTPTNNQEYDWSKFTLLIVEDDKFNIAYFTELFGTTGINLLIGETGRHAISLFTKNQNIDLVLMDIKLPDMSGYEVTMEFKKIRPEIPIIAQTAYAAETDKQKALDAGCDDFITKPIKRNSFLELINGYLITKSKN